MPDPVAVVFQPTPVVAAFEAEPYPLAAGPTAPPGPPGIPGGRVTATAGQTLSGHRAVAFSDAGEVVYADNATPGHAWASVGITAAAALSGADVEVVTAGELVEPSWSWTPGLPVFVGAGGVLTQDAPQDPGVFCRVIGVPSGVSSLVVGAQVPVFIA